MPYFCYAPSLHPSGRKGGARRIADYIVTGQVMEAYFGMWSQSSPKFASRHQGSVVFPTPTLVNKIAKARISDTRNHQMSSLFVRKSVMFCQTFVRKLIQNTSSCGARRHFFWLNRKTCHPLEQEHVFLFNQTRCPPAAQEHTSSCAKRRHVFLLQR